jgi:hypothetical protein
MFPAGRLLLDSIKREKFIPGRNTTKFRLRLCIARTLLHAARVTSNTCKHDSFNWRCAGNYRALTSLPSLLKFHSEVSRLGKLTAIAIIARYPTRRDERDNCYHFRVEDYFRYHHDVWRSVVFLCNNCRDSRIRRINSLSLWRTAHVFGGSYRCRLRMHVCV